MEAIWLSATIAKVMGMSGLGLREKHQQSNVKYVTRLAKQRMMNTIIKHGQMAQQMRQPHSIMDRHLIRKDLKTTKFMPSKVKEFKDEIDLQAQIDAGGL